MTYNWNAIVRGFGNEGTIEGSIEALQNTHIERTPTNNSL